MPDSITPSLQKKFRDILGVDNKEDQPLLPPLPQAAPSQAIQPAAPTPQFSAPVATPEPAPVEAETPLLLISDGLKSRFANILTPPEADPVEKLKSRLQDLKKISKGEMADPLLKEESDPTREFIEKKGAHSVDPFSFFEYGPEDSSRPTKLKRPLSELSNKDREVAISMMKTFPDFLDENRNKSYDQFGSGQGFLENVSRKIDLDEQTYNEAHRRGYTSWIDDMARIVVKSENWFPAFNRGGAGAIKGASFHMKDPTQEAAEDVKELGEQWLRASAIPETVGEVGGMVTFGGPVIGAITKTIGMSGQALSRLAPYIFNSRVVTGASNAASKLETLAQTNTATRITTAATKGAVSEGALGAAIDLAGDKGDDYKGNRVDDALHSAFYWAVGGAVVRTGIKAAEVVRDKRFASSIDTLAKDLNISKEEAEGIVQTRFQGERLKDIKPEAVTEIPRQQAQTFIDSIKTNKGIINLSEKQGISLSEAATIVKSRNPSAPIDLKLIEKSKDIEAASEGWFEWMQRNNFGLDAAIKTKAGRTVFAPTTRMLEKAGEWLHNPNGLTVFPGVQITNDKALGMRDFIFGTKSKVEVSLQPSLDAIEVKRRALTLKNDRLAKATDEAVEGLEKTGISRDAAIERIGQVERGGTDKSPTIQYLGEEYRRIKEPLQDELLELGIMLDSRYLKTSKKQIHKIVTDKESLIEKVTAEIQSPSLKKFLAKDLREQKFESAEEMASYLKDAGVTNAMPEDIKMLHDKAGFLRAKYKEDGKVHMARFFLKHPEGRKAALGYGLKAEARPMDQNYYKQKQDISKEALEDMGELNNTILEAHKSVERDIQNVMRGRHMQVISENPLASRKIAFKSGGRIDDDALKLMSEEGWTHIPKDKKWGHLQDHVVSPEIARDFKHAGLLKSEDPRWMRGAKAAVEGYKQGMRLWKFGKVVINPATHGRNMVSASIMADMSGMGFVDQTLILPKAARELHQKGKIWEEAHTLGLFGNEFVSEEVKLILSREMERANNHFEGLQNAFNKTAEKGVFKRSVEAASKKIKFAAGKAAQIYQAEDQMFKLAKYMHMRGQGYSKTVAKAEAEKWFFNYSDVSPAIKYAKDYYSPFITYQAKAIPRFYETIIERPWKIAKYGVYMNALGSIDQAIPDLERSQYGLVNSFSALVSDDMKREINALQQWRAEKPLPEWSKSSLNAIGLPMEWLTPRAQLAVKKAGLFIPRMVKLPFVDKFEQTQFLDLGGMTPFGGILDQPKASKLGVPRVFYPQHPVIDIYTMAAQNKHPFFGTDVVKTTDTNWEKAQKFFHATADTLLPSTVFLPGSYNFNKLMAAQENMPDSQDRFRALTVALMDVTLGFKVRPFNLELEAMARIEGKDGLESQIADVERDRDRLGQMMDKNADDYSDEDRELQEKIVSEKIRRLYKMIGSISNFRSDEFVEEEE